MNEKTANEITNRLLKIEQEIDTQQRITLHLTPMNDEEVGPHVCWYGLAGYDEITFYFASPEAAQAFHQAAQQVTEIEAD